MQKLLIKWGILAIAIVIAIKIVPGIGGASGNFGGLDPVAVVVIALILGLVNVLIRPVIKILSCPLRILTLGLFTFVINAAMLLLTSAIARNLGWDFHVDGFIPALLGSIVISIVNIILNIVLVSDKDE